MKITVESTSQIVELVTREGSITARVWQGHTDSGIPVHCFITRIGVDKHADTSQFEKELEACAAPRPELGVYALSPRLAL